MSLNKQQREAALHGEGPALVLAGPGSGKTTVLMVRTAYLIFELGIKPGQILALTFNKAAQMEMDTRFQRLFGDQLSEPVRFSTLHSFCYGVVRQYERRQGKKLRLIEGGSSLEPGEQANGDLSKYALVRRIYGEINGVSPQEEEMENALNEISRLKNKRLSEEEIKDFRTKNFPLVFKAYEGVKKQNLLMDFDDMLIYADAIFRKCPDLLQRSRESFRFFQVDEGQDLSQIQFDILRRLVPDQKGNLFIVADDDQSIYGFRGAEPRHILKLGESYASLKFYKLEQNYRSIKEVVDLSSQFIKTNEARYEKSHFTENPSGMPPQTVKSPDMEQQYTFIRDRLKAGDTSDKSFTAAILYRNNLSAVSLSDFLDRNRIPFTIRQGKSGFFSHWLVRDMTAYLSFLANPYDGEAFSRFFSKLNRYISRAMVEFALMSREPEPFIKRMLACPELNNEQRKRIKLLSGEFKRLSGSSPLHALEYLEDQFKYFGSIQSFAESTGQSMDYLYKLFDTVKTIASPCRSFLEMLERLSSLPALLEKPVGGPEREGFQLTLSTLHASKGLEYDKVFMIDLFKEEIPGESVITKAYREKDTSELEEERRLFYVGMTRARRELYLLSPDSRCGRALPRTLFLNELASINAKLSGNGSPQAEEGVTVIHKKYGRGVIVAAAEAPSGNVTLEVDFSGRVRRLDLGICMEQGILVIED